MGCGVDGGRATAPKLFAPLSDSLRWRAGRRRQSPLKSALALLAHRARRDGVPRSFSAPRGPRGGGEDRLPHQLASPRLASLSRSSSSSSSSPSSCCVAALSFSLSPSAAVLVLECSPQPATRGTSRRTSAAHGAMAARRGHTAKKTRSYAEQAAPRPRGGKHTPLYSAPPSVAV